MKKVKQKHNSAAKIRKIYKKPELTVFGTINQLTESLTSGKFSDGGTGKTSMQS